MKRFKVKLNGITPLMHHKMTEESLFGLLGGKTDKKKDKEILTPRQIADKHAYRDNDGCYVIPTSYIVGAFKHVSGDYKQKNSARKSIKGIAGGIFTPDNMFEPLTDDKEKPLKDYEVDLQKGTNHLKGAIAICRPRFDKWNCTFTVSIDEDLISPETALQILNDAGKRSGIGSFRVSKGGSYGKFVVTEWTQI